MEPVDEFDFKPITEGLGFHRKQVDLKNQMKAAKVVSETLGKPTPTKAKPAGATLKSPLPRKEAEPSSSPQPMTPSKDVIDELVRSFKKPAESFIEETKTPQVIIKPTNPQKIEGTDPLPWMLSPFFVDAMLVVAIMLSCLLVTLLVTKADLLLILIQSPSDINFKLVFVAMVSGMSFVYMTMARILLGASIGEMVFDIQLGTLSQRNQFLYGIQVLWRSLLAILTGFILLPLLSMIFRKDILGTLSGLKLFRRKV